VHLLIARLSPPRRSQAGGLFFRAQFRLQSLAMTA
jgi:hypothetical protein